MYGHISRLIMFLKCCNFLVVHTGRSSTISIALCKAQYIAKASPSQILLPARGKILQGPHLKWIITRIYEESYAALQYVEWTTYNN
jgi:hypothetical protein